MSPEERARFLLLPTTDEAEGSVPRERSKGQDPGEDGQWDDASLPSTIEYPDHPSTDLVISDDNSWCVLSDTSKLASTTASFSFVGNVEGITDLNDEETSPFTLVALANMVK